MEFPEWCPDKQPAAHASIVVELSCFGRSRAIRQSYTRNSKKNGALQGGLWLNLAVSLVLLFVLCFVLTVTANNRLEPNYIYIFQSYQYLSFFDRR